MTTTHNTLLMDQERIERVRRLVLAWGRRNYKSFPWREETDPWLTLAAEMMLQRTRASQVAPVFDAFRAAHPTAASLVAAGPSAVREYTDRLGLHWRGDLLFRTAESVTAVGGVPPSSLEDLRRIPGVGQYTAAAWLSMHRGVRAHIVDANVARWLSRLVGLPSPADPRHCRWLHDLADRLTPRRAFRAYNYAVLDFTMEICTPRNPRCPTCPLLAYCEYGKACRVR